MEPVRNWIFNIAEHFSFLTQGYQDIDPSKRTENVFLHRKARLGLLQAKELTGYTVDKSAAPDQQQPPWEP